MNPYYQDKATIYHGDCREVLPTLSGASAIVTDPPYELGFMGKSWDSKGISFQKETWEIIRQSCLSGAMLLSFGGTRTSHRIACAIEDAGWEIRDTLMWVYGSGFPKSLDIGKAVDKVQGNGREYLRTEKTQPKFKYSGSGKLQEKWIDKNTKDITKGNTVWEGYGTALKPAYEPIILAMNPLDGTFANNALKHGVAGLNIEECRIQTSEQITNHSRGSESAISKGKYGDSKEQETHQTSGQSLGRFPANFIHDGSQMVMELFPNVKSGVRHCDTDCGNSIFGKRKVNTIMNTGDSGSAARFFYCAKASRAERDRGCEEIEAQQMDESRKEGNPGGDNPRNRGVHKVKNNHPTVKPLALIEYLVKLVKMPEYNLIIDPLMGSGTTLLACIRLDIPCIGIDNDEKSCEIAAGRCSQEVMELV